MRESLFRYFNKALNPDPRVCRSLIESSDRLSVLGRSCFLNRKVKPLYWKTRYPIETWRKSLMSNATNAEIDPNLGHALEFINPGNGGPVMLTISAHVRMIPAGFERPHPLRLFGQGIPVKTQSL